MILKWVRILLVLGAGESSEGIQVDLTKEITMRVHFSMRVFMIFVLFLGNLSCNEDREEEFQQLLEISSQLVKNQSMEEEVGKSRWKLERVVVRREGGWTSSLEDFNGREDSYFQITDEIFFPEVPPNVTISIETFCGPSGNRVRGRWVGLLKNSLPVRELIPIRAYSGVDLPRHQEDVFIRCQMHFFAQNKARGGHSFQLNNVAIKGAAEEFEGDEPLPLSRLIPLNSTMSLGQFIEASSRESYIKMLPLHLFCQKFELQLQPDEVLETKIQSKYGEKFLYQVRQSQSQSCRLVLAKGGYVRQISKKFQLHFKLLEPQIDEKLLIPESYSSYKELILDLKRVSIYNPHSVDLHLLIPQGQVNKLIYTPTGYVSHRGESTDVQLEGHFNIEWSNDLFVRREGAGFFVDLPPGQSVTFKVKVRLPAMLCTSHPGGGRYRYQWRESGLWIKTISDLSIQLLEPSSSATSLKPLELGALGELEALPSLKSYPIKEVKGWVGARLHYIRKEHQMREKRPYTREEIIMFLKKELALRSNGIYYYKPVEVNRIGRLWRRLSCRTQFGSL